MSKIIHFIPKADSDAKTNVKEFIAACRYELKIFGSDLEWDSGIWDVTSAIQHRGRSARLAFSWTNHDTSKTNTTAPQMTQPYLDFARAYMRYTQAIRPTTNTNFRLSAVRALERALCADHPAPDISNADAVVFNRASSLIKKKFSSAAAYRIGGQLEMIADFINDHGMTPARFTWKNPFTRDSDRNRVGKKFDEDRLKRLPDDGAIESLAKAFHLAREPHDVIISSIGALLTTSPDRINEVFRLPVMCEVEKENADGSLAYGLRWWPSKGADPFVKWIGTTMVDVAKEAIKKIRKATDHARSVAQWYETNPGSMWLPPECEYLRSESISLAIDFIPVLGTKDRNAVNQWLNVHKVPCQKIDHKNYVRFSDVEAAVIELLPRGFPVLDSDTGLKYSEALFVVPRYLFSNQRSSIPCLVEPVTTDHVNNGLGASVQHGKSSIFTRLDLTSPDGNVVRITTHQFRHWLNTIAQRGGLSQLDIAKWSGRKDVRQNEAYDHVSADEMLMMVRDLGETNMIGPFAEVIEKMPVTREEFLQMKFPTAHVTEYGFCVHDYAMLPCQRHRDCINCTEHICVKGDVEKTKRIRESLALVNDQIEQAVQANDENAVGADRWLAHHKKTAERLRGLIDILDNTSVPNGSVIQLSNPNEYSPFAIAVDNRKLFGDEDSKILSDYRALTGRADEEASDRQ